MRGFNAVGRFMIYLLISFVIIVLIGVAVYVVSTKTGPTNSPTKAVKKQANANALVPVTRTNANGSTTTAYLVPASRVPLTPSAENNAAADTLIPSDWAADPQNVSGSGPDADPVIIPTPERTAIAKAVSHFLAAWETFTPPETAADAEQTLLNYQQRLAPYTDSGDLVTIISRVDSHQPSYICPDINCGVGSVWIPNDQSDAMVVRSWSQAQAYITTYGAVTYVSRAPKDYEVAGYTYARSYGIILAKEGNSWVVTRAAANTVDRLT